LLLGSYLWFDKDRSPSFLRAKQSKNNSEYQSQKQKEKKSKKQRIKTNPTSNAQRNKPQNSKKILTSQSLWEKYRDHFRWSRGGIIGKKTRAKEISLIFSGHNYYYGMKTILKTLTKEKIKAGFFFTGVIYNKRNGIRYIKRLVRQGHYLGPHSYGHIMYHRWGSRRVRISKKRFRRDLNANIRQVQKYFSINKSIKLFLPPYETYNHTISSWTRQSGYQIISYTPRSLTHKDWIFRYSHRYISSARLLRRLLHRARQNKLKGAILLIHTGISAKARREPFYKYLPRLVSALKKMGYRFRRIDRLLTP
jgi:peptidoglycan/xylan/chitin deacetylase (PgdA/CDA1 family)